MATDYIWIQDAVRIFSRSREWIYQQVRAGKLHSYTAPGDRRIYLDREELTRFLQLRPMSGEEEQPEGRTA